uniref:RNA helicase n=1 Tax=Tetraodon nigroviridis TaxID=99883 RepID=H3D2C6_TETNG
FGLYPYQQEVVERALRGENIIICLPTGAGKTRAAVYVAKRHLETTANAKVVVLVNKVHLVDQHHSKEFQPHLSPVYRVVPVSGDNEEKDFFGRVLKDSDVVICTAQILYNAMINKEDAKHAELSDITLLIIDECHHTNKEAVYNQIMSCYVEKKQNGEQPLPQVLGLTASLGTGGARTLQDAVEHVLQICANLDSGVVSTKRYVPELEEKVPRPVKTFDIAEERPKDPFGNHLKSMMQMIHDFMDLPDPIKLRECGTQEYETDVVLLERDGVKEGNRVWAQCALHLRQYNDALLIHDTLRMTDAFRSLEDFYRSKVGTEIDGTDFFLVALFYENRAELKMLAADSRYENPKMSQLERVLLNQFGPDVESRGILFKSTHCLHDWVSTSTALKGAGIKAAILTGAGNGIDHMSHPEQKDTIRSFRQGRLNLLISTSVAEEGLDIPECNLVVRYGLLTNEIAQIQASGRARARNSQYSVVAQRHSREVRRESLNEHLEELGEQAVAKVQDMTPPEFAARIKEMQTESIRNRRAAESKKAKRRSQHTAARVQLLCRNCFRQVASGSDIRLVDNTHYVNINPDFKRFYKTGERVIINRRFEDWEPGRTISCSNGSCNKKWGAEIKYKKVALLPNLSIENFALETPEGRMTPRKWKDITFTVDNFSFEEYCRDLDLDPDLDLDLFD